MLVKHKQVGTKGMFYIEQDSKMLAESVYTLSSQDKMIIEHTEVDDALRGQNAGYQLVNAGVEYARQHNMKIIPLCPFANALFKRKPEFSDVLYNL